MTTRLVVSLAAYAHRMGVLADAWAGRESWMLDLAVRYASGSGECPCEHCYYWRNN